MVQNHLGQITRNGKDSCINLFNSTTNKPIVKFKSLQAVQPNTIIIYQFHKPSALVEKLKQI